MLLTEIVALAEQQYGARYLLKEDVLLSYVNTIQQLAYKKDLNAFLTYDTYLTVWTELSVSAGVAVESMDLGLVVANFGSTATGYLRYYSASKGIWAVEMISGTFSDGDALTIGSGTGTGTINADPVVFRGPYAPDGDYECRKLVGVTTLTDSQIFNAPSHNFMNAYTDDYGMNIDSPPSDNRYVRGRLNRLSNSFTFPFDPVETEDYYRFVYYIQPPAITTINDEANFLIPESSRYTVVFNGVIALANKALYNDDPTTPDALLRPFLEVFWEEMGEMTDGQGWDTNLSQGI